MTSSDTRYYMELDEGVQVGRRGTPQVDRISIRRRGEQDSIEFHEMPTESGRMYNLGPTLEKLGWRLVTEAEYINGRRVWALVERIEDARPEALPALEKAELPAGESNASEPAWQAANFDDFAIGDRVRFQTIDNGFGGSGDFIMRTGKVTAVTPRTLRVECDPSPFGSRAVLSQTNWYHRHPQKPAPATCIHGNTPRPDVTGNPIKACANAGGGTEWGAFNAEGCTYRYDCAVDVANESAKENEEAEASPDDPESRWGEMCRDHEEQLAGDCAECFADESEDEEDGDGEV